MSGKCFLFDLDGTLLNSGEGITEGVSYAISKLGLSPLDLETRKKFVGPALRESFCKYCGVNEETAEKMLAAYREYYGARGLYECIPYEGIEDILKYIKNAGHIAYVATAKPTEYAKKMLEKWNLLKYFKDVIGASFDKSRDDKKVIIADVLCAEKDKEAVMVGDTRYDIVAAHQNGIGCIAVTYGYGSIEEIMEEKPEYVADNVEKLKEIVENY